MVRLHCVMPDARSVPEVHDGAGKKEIEVGVFRKGSAKAIARSLKRSADRSRRRKSAPFRSAMSMLTFYVNRGGKNLSATQRKKLDRAKDELRELYGKAG